MGAVVVVVDSEVVGAVVVVVDSVVEVLVSSFNLKVNKFPILELAGAAKVCFGDSEMKAKAIRREATKRLDRVNFILKIIWTASKRPY